MLVLTRKIGERIVIDNHIVIEVTAVQGQCVRLGIEAPEDLVVLRAELIETDSVSGRREPTN